MNVTNIVITRNENGTIEEYIVRFEGQKGSSNFDGQMTIAASEADLATIEKVAEKKLKMMIEQEQPE